MSCSIKPLLAAGLLLSVTPFTGHAALIDRGNGLLYDDMLDITWLQDANYAKTSGYDVDGKMEWSRATAWADNLVYGGYSDWRLASNTPINGSSFNYTLKYDGSSDRGYNITSPYSELAYMYYANLDLKSSFSTSATSQEDYGIFGNGTYNGTNIISFGQNDVGLVKNLQAYYYWSGTNVPNSAYVWAFNNANGDQIYSDKTKQFYAWAVRDGDVAGSASAVPVPAALWLFSSGLLGLMELKRRGSIMR
ncbi:hypothetical protein [Methylobacter sp. sgz302048]|uniref:hypothetical protein n=1 Tax=Methylobacter sp. sgz302048 TaxID=3455945 RepID=UPI003F9ED633